MPGIGAADGLPCGLDQAADETPPGRTQANGPGDLGPVDLGSVDLGSVDLSSVDLGSADLGWADLGPGVDPGGSAVVETWPATSRTRLPSCVSYIDVRPGAPGRTAVS